MDPKNSRGRKRGPLLLLVVVASVAGVAIASLSRSDRLDLVTATAPLSPQRAEAQPRRRLESVTVAREDGFLPPRLSDRSKEELMALLREKLAMSPSADEARALLSEIAGTNPLLALDLAQTAGRTAEEKYLLATSVLRLWGQKNFPAAFHWVLQQDNRLDLSGELPLTAVVMDEAALSDPLTVVSSIDALLLRSGSPSPGIEPAALASTAVESLLKAGQNDVAKVAIEQWANGPAANKLDNSAFERMALRLAESSPQEAGAWLLSLPAGEARNYAVSTLAATWTEKDAAGAAAWAAQLDPPNGRLNALQRVLTRWADRDPVATVQWLGKNETDSAMDPLIANLLNESTLPLIHPEVAAQWAELITEPNLRAQTLEQVIVAWASQDRSAALRQTNESTLLSPEQKRRLIEKLQSK